MPESRKVAIITGASQGIGAGLAAAFRSAGYAVVATSRSIRSLPTRPTSSPSRVTSHEPRLPNGLSMQQWIGSGGSTA